MATSGYQAWSVSAGEVPTTAYWNILGSNDASLSNGNGIQDGAIGTRQLASNSVTYISQIWSDLISSSSQTYVNTWTTITSWNAGSLTTHGGWVVFHLQFSTWNNTSGAQVSWRLVLNGSGYVPAYSGSTFMVNAVSTHVPISRTYVVTTLAASTYTVGLQLNSSTGTGTVDGSDTVSLTAIEIMK